MALITEQIPNLMNGVSQQAITLRMSSQCEEQINGYSSVVEGVNKRPPTEHIGKLTGLTGTPYIYTVNRDSDERYIVVIGTNSIRVFDLDGNELTLTDNSGGSYLNATDPRGAFRAATIGDYTLILNREKEVAELAGNARAANRDKLLFVKGVNYGVKYEVKLEGTVVASFDVPAATNNPKIGTDLVAADLLTQLDALNDSRFTFSRKDNIILIEPTTANDHQWEFFDDFTGIYTEVVNPEMTSMSDLPLKAPNGFFVKITGDVSSEVDDYYVEFKTDTGAAGIGEGYWEETIGPDIAYRLDASTMPHQLVRNSDGTFTFDEITWGERKVGDLETAPWPSFTGNKIADIYYDRNRLCFLSKENVIMSRARALFEFFPTTVTTILDDGPIDVAASGSRVANLRAAVPFNKEVILFADQTQFTIDDENLLASEPPAVKNLTDYETDKDVFPVAVGKNLYFTVTRGSFTSVMEYYVVDDTQATDAADVTKHVPSYIPKGAYKLAATPTTDVLFCLTEDQPNRVYVYKYYWRGVEKMQSSWSYWDFPAATRVLNVDFIKDEAFFVMEYPEGIFIEKMVMSEGLVDTGMEFSVRCDRKLTEAGVSAPTVTDLGGGSYTSEIQLPYAVNSDDLVVTIRPGGLADDPVGSQPEIISVVTASGASTITVSGDLSTANFYIGTKYTFRYTFSEPVIKTGAAQGGLATVTGGRLQVLRWLMSFDKTGYFRAEVSPGPGRGTYTYAYSGKVLGTASATIGQPAITDGVFQFPIKAKAKNVTITLINDSVLPSYFTAAEWEGRYERRTSR